MSRKYNAKIIVIGDSNVGKTSIINKYVNKNFSLIYKATIGTDFFTKEFFLDNDKITLQIWDTAGNEKFHSLGTSFYRGTDGCILVFDVTNNKSFYNLQNWYDEFILAMSPKNVEDVENFPLLLFGNKTDLIDNSTIEISEKQIMHFCRNKNIKYFPISVKNEKSVIEHIINNFGQEIYYKNKENSFPIETENINLNENKEKNKCCFII